MSSNEMTREQFENMVLAKAAEDETFRGALLKSPKEAIAKALGKTLPAALKLEVVQEAADRMVIVLPDFAALLGAKELSDDQLAMVAAGSSTSTGTCGSSNCSVGCSTTGSFTLTTSWRDKFTLKGF